MTSKTLKMLPSVNIKEEIQTMKIPNKKSSLSLYHINTCSLTKNFEDLEYLLKT